MIFDRYKTNVTDETPEQVKAHIHEYRGLQKIFEGREDESAYQHLAYQSIDIENLDIMVTQYEIYGTYMNYIVDEDEECNRGRTPGLYFVFGLDKDYIVNCEFDMRTLLNRQRHYPGLVYTRAIAIKINERDKAVIVREVIHKARLLQSIRIICERRGITIPAELGLGELEFLHAQLLYASQENSGVLRDICNDMITKYMKMLTKLDKQDTFFKRKYRSYCFSNRNYTSGLKTVFSLNFLWYCFFGSNKVSYKTILRRSDKIGTIVIEDIVWKKFKKILKNYPDCIYAVCPGDTGKVVKEDPGKYLRKKDRRNPRKNPMIRVGEVGYKGIHIMYPLQWEDVISWAYHMSFFSAYGGVTCEEMLEEDDIAAFVIPYVQFGEFHQGCEEKGIPYAYDLGGINKKEMGGLYDVPILVNAANAREVMTILKAINRKEMSYRIPGDGRVPGHRPYVDFSRNGYQYTDFDERIPKKMGLFGFTNDNTKKNNDEMIDLRREYYSVIKGRR